MKVFGGKKQNEKQTETEMNLSYSLNYSIPATKTHSYSVAANQLRLE